MDGWALVAMDVFTQIVRKTGCGLFFFSILSLAWGCAHMGHEPSEIPASELPTRVSIPSVPFYPQEAYQCGPAAMVMVLNWSQTSAGKEDLVQEVYTPALKGTLQSAMIGAARRHNRLPYPVRDTNQLLQEIAAGHPVIVLQNLAFSWFPRWHYAVVMGYDLEGGTFTLHSGKEEGRQVKWDLFMRTWKRADKWGLVVLPVTELPASVDERSYLEAVLGLEQTGQYEGASKAYGKALEKWPFSLGALMGLGNCLYIQGDLRGAERAFRQAVEAHPKSGAAFNNLAHVLAEQGHLPEALEKAKRAVSLGGASQSLYEKTLREINSLELQPFNSGH